VVNSDAGSYNFDQVINATGYQSLLPKNIKSDLPFDIDVVYQPCLALSYNDKQPLKNPFSFIVMDGWFPCIMPYIDEMLTPDQSQTKYILTHGKYTIMASCETYEEAQTILSQITDSFIIEEIKPPSEFEINRFWPEFDNRFEYTGWKGEVLAKIRTKNEFRSAVTFTCPDDVIHVIPGKVSNIFDVEKEVIALIDNINCCSKNGYRFVINGVLNDAHTEIINKPEKNEHNTGFLNTFKELNSKNESNHVLLSLFKNINSPSLNATSSHSCNYTQQAL
jgi:hypothetical protein